MSLNEDFISRLIKTRSALGWSQANLSKASGISATQLSRYESGLSEPRPQALGRLAKALNVQFDWLARGEGPVEGETPDRPLPPGMRTLSLDLSDQELEEIQQFAAKENLTAEMAVRQLFLAALADKAGFKAIGGKSAIDLLQKELNNAKTNFEELAQRISKLEERR